jgi:diguanylate cyclase (GGDEF)-like protein/PAS domain S-box-containing protein
MSDTFYRALVEHGPAVSYVSVFNDAETLFYVSPQLKTLLGYDPDTWQTRPGFWRSRLHPDDRDRVLEAFDLGRYDGKVSLEYRFLAQDGSIVWVHDLAVLTCDLLGTPTGWHGMLIEISDRKVREQDLASRAFHDPLTHLPNRALLLKRVEQAIKRATSQQEVVALVYVDLDDFKDVNDRFGHALGDRLLIEVAKRIRSRLRSIDTVSRVGGDEFIILIEGVKSADEARQIAERIGQGMDEIYVLNDQQIRVTSSLGLAVSSLDSAGNMNELLRLADAAMYDAKRNGKARLALAETVHYPLEAN